jgi:hypothetical protein
MQFVHEQFHQPLEWNVGRARVSSSVLGLSCQAHWSRRIWYGWEEVYWKALSFDGLITGELQVLPYLYLVSFHLTLLYIMATAPPPRPAGASNVSHSRTIISICVPVGVIFIIIFVSWIVRRIHPLVALPPLERPRIREYRPRKGIARSILDSIPVIRYSTGTQLNKQERGLDLERYDANRGTSLMRQEGLVLRNAGQTRRAGGMPEASVEVEKEKGGEPGRHFGTRQDELTTLSMPNGSLEGQHLPSGIEQADCPVCREDFLGSDDVRVLPCGHIYHQRCIDPWLLDFAGTCPLWYAIVHRQHL